MAKALGKAIPVEAVVLYDPNCRLCRELAYFMSKLCPSEFLEFVPSEEQAPKELVIKFKSGEPTESSLGSEDWLSGISAWQWLLEHHPTLAPLHWLAEKLFIKRPAALALATGADILRKICGHC